MSTTDRATRTQEIQPRESTSSDLTVAEVLSALTPDLQDILADLDGAPNRLAELVVGLLPNEDFRDVLLEYGVVESVPIPGGTQRTTRVTLTPFGRRVIEACFAGRTREGSKHDLDDLERRAERLRRRLQADSLPMETREARP